MSIADLDPDATPGFPGKGKDDAVVLTREIGLRLSELQERLYAEGKDPDGPNRSVLVILQGMDTSGKGGTIRHVFGLVDPQGLSLHAFKQPNAIEQAHPFLWRIRQYLPARGMIGIYDRSQYEDVLVVRVDQLVPASTWRQRYELINTFERKLVDSGTTVIKCFLSISADEQKARLLERLGDPAKHWKYSHGDIGVRSKWPLYMKAYEDALTKCNTDEAPWYVIPANKKWYRNWAVASLLLEALEDMDLTWPKGDFNVEEEIAAVEGALSPTRPVTHVTSPSGGKKPSAGGKSSRKKDGKSKKADKGTKR